MQKITNTMKYVKVVLLSMLVAVVFIPASSAIAGSTGWDDFGSSGDYYFDTYTPSYYMDSYTPSYSDYSSPSYDYGSYSAPSYSYGGGSGYSYVPQPSYSYIPAGGGLGGGFGGGSSAPQSQYVYSSNENTNANSNTNNNTITNTFNPTNNNDARINLIVYGGGGTTGTNTNTEQTLDGNCTINPTIANINQDVSFYVNATGGVGGYSYTWTGTDGIYSSAQSFTGRYSNPGFKTATVTIRSGSQTISRTCSVNVQAFNTVLNTQSNVTVLRDQNLGTPVSGVFLSQVPETGVGFGLKMTLFTLGLTLWSIFAAFMIARKKNGVALSKINAFKLANMQKKGIQG